MSALTDLLIEPAQPRQKSNASTVWPSGFTEKSFERKVEFDDFAKDTHMNQKPLINPIF